MAKSAPLGFTTCPDCLYGDCEVKQAKSGLAYRWCPDCNVQTFCRNQQQSDRMIASILAVTAPVTVTEKIPATITEKPIAKAVKAAFSLGDL